MDSDSSFFPVWLFPLIFGSFLIGFPVIWCSVLLLLSRIGGWHRLALRYAAGDQSVSGERHGRLSGLIGGISYRNVLTLQLNDDGFFIEVMPLFRVGHPKLFIPWTEITSRTRCRYLWMDGERLSVGHPTVVNLSLPAKVLNGRPTQ